MSTLPEPLVPADVDLRDFAFMPLDVLRLRDSDLATLATGEEFKAAVLLWCFAWHQVPAASLPDDDRVLARHSGAGAGWKNVREEALRGFVLCSDLRFYHPVIAEKAIEAWQKRSVASRKGKAGASARWMRGQCPSNGTGNGTGNARAMRKQSPSNGTSNAPEQENNEIAGETDATAIAQAMPKNGKGQGHSSGTYVPAAVAADDPLETIWKTGVQIICATGSKEATARAFLGALCKTHGEAAVAEKIAYLTVHPAADPRGWLRGALANGTDRRHHGSRSAADRVRDANPLTPDPEIDRYF